MSVLWFGALITIIVVLAAVVLPLLRKQKADAGAARAEYDVAIYKDQLAEVERDLERGLLSDAQATAVRTEIQRKLLAAADSSAATTSPKSAAGQSPSVVTAGAIVLFVSVGSFGLYNYLGSPEIGNFAYAERDIKVQRHAGQGPAGQEMEQLLGQLTDRLKKDPNDAAGWLLLGRSLMSQSRFEDSVNAFRQAYTLRPDDLDIAVDFAVAETYANNGQVSTSAYEIFLRAFEVSKIDPKIRHHIAVYKAQNGDFRAALQGWTDIIAMSPPGAPWLSMVNRQMEFAAKESGIDLASIAPSAEAVEIGAEGKRQAMAAAQRQASTMTAPRSSSGSAAPGSSAPGSSAPGPSAEDVKVAQDMSATDRNEMILGMVNRLAERLNDEPNDLEGWQRLARAYQVLGEKDKAAEARQRIKALQGQ